MAAPAPTAFPARIVWGQSIPMRDGVHLNGTLYLPAGQERPGPALLAMTPYISDTYHLDAVAFAWAGFAFLVVDVRGRGNSEGRFRPFLQEAEDGHDLVEWMARQPWCGGKVGMWGGSYLGHCQWAAARTRPPHLATIAPMAAPFAGIDFPMRNGVFRPSNLRWLLVTAGKAAQTKIGADRAYWSALYESWYRSGRPFRELDRLAGFGSDIFQAWVAHPEPDAYWDAHNPSDADYAALDLPVLTVTGSYDDDQPGALEHYRRHRAAASAEARARHFLIIGPWDHRGSAGWPTAAFGGAEFGEASRLDMPALLAAWYRWTMADGPKPALLARRVAYYVTGAEQWRHADELDDVAIGCMDLHLTSKGGANRLAGDGLLSDTAGAGPPDLYVFDPRKMGEEVAAEAAADGASLTDPSLILALDGRQLVYHSRLLTAPVEIAGFFRLTAWLSIDTPDTDFFVSVHEIAPDGSSLRLSSDVIRARYRGGLDRPELVATDAPLPYHFERFTFVARRMPAGSRLRLVIAPLGRVVETNFVQRNFQGGGAVAAESIADARTVTVRLHHDDRHRSVLTVPLGAAQDAITPQNPEGR